MKFERESFFFILLAAFDDIYRQIKHKENISIHI